jgi:hypothetical protein
MKRKRRRRKKRCRREAATNGLAIGNDKLNLNGKCKSASRRQLTRCSEWCWWSSVGGLEAGTSESYSSETGGMGATDRRRRATGAGIKWAHRWATSWALIVWLGHASAARQPQTAADGLLLLAPPPPSPPNGLLEANASWTTTEAARWAHLRRQQASGSRTNSSWPGPPIEADRGHRGATIKRTRRQTAPPAHQADAGGHQDRAGKFRVPDWRRPAGRAAHFFC